MSEAQTQIFFHGLKLLAVIVLSLIVVFRRQMSCNSVYVDDDDDENDECADSCSGKKRRKIVCPGRDENRDSTNRERVCQSNKRIHYAAFESFESIRRIQTIICHAALKIVKKDLDCATEEVPFAERCSNNNFSGSDLDVSQRSSSRIPKRRYSATHLLGLLPDIQIHIISYLHPRDVIMMSCCDHVTQTLINGDEGATRHSGGASTLLWFTLWNRDYGWVLREWNIGLEATQRSCGSILSPTNNNTLCCPLIIAANLNINTSNLDNHIQETNRNGASNAATPSMKEFYLIFSLTWQEYCIAGHSTATSCLTRIHGHVFDMTDFLPKHPGSPDSLIMHGGGKDATSIFESVGHSFVARKIAWGNCALAVDVGCCGSFDGTDGSSPHGGRRRRGCGVVSAEVMAGREGGLESMIPKKRSKPRVTGTLLGARKRFLRERESAWMKAVQAERESAKRGGGDILGNINVYFDPICQRWKGWYLNMEFCPEFLHEL